MNTNRQKTDELMKKSTNDGRKKSPNTTKEVEKQNKHTCISEEREMQALMWIKDSYVEMEWCRIWMCCYCVTGLIYKRHSESQQPDGQNKKPGLWLVLALHHCCLDKLKGSDSLFGILSYYIQSMRSDWLSALSGCTAPSLCLALWISFCSWSLSSVFIWMPLSSCCLRSETAVSSNCSAWSLSTLKQDNIKHH